MTTALNQQNAPTGGLRERFENFIRTMPDFESIDELLKGRDPNGMKRADYLLHQRSVIVEQKTLEVDPEEKGQRHLDQLMKERGILAYGQLPAHAILSGQPDAAVQNRRLFDKLTAVIQENVSSADKQTRDTKEIFGLKGMKAAGGLLVILNEAAPTLDPAIVCHRIGRLISARLPDGSLRYPHNQIVVYIQESHGLAGHSSDLIPAIILKGPEWNMALQVEWIANEMLKGWATFNGRPYIEGPNNDLSALQQLRRRSSRPGS